MKYKTVDWLAYNESNMYIGSFKDKDCALDWAKKHNGYIDKHTTEHDENRIYDSLLRKDEREKCKAKYEAKIARLTAENADLHARLDKAVILPCKCEDTLYCVHWSKYNPKGGIITEEFVHKITLNDRNNTYTIHTICNGIWTESKFVAIDFGDILFTDRAKAEARLAELKGGEEE